MQDANYEPSSPHGSAARTTSPNARDDDIPTRRSVQHSDTVHHAIAASENGEDHYGEQVLRSSSNVQGDDGIIRSPGVSPHRPLSYGPSGIGGHIFDRSSNTTSDVSWLPPRHSNQPLLTRSADNLGGNGFRGALLANNSHVPSLHQRAFLQPMSSQQLQAARGQQAPAPTTFVEKVNADLDDRSFTNRNSTGSALTIKGGHALPTQHDVNTMPRMGNVEYANGYDGTNDDQEYDHEVNGLDNMNEDDHELFTQPNGNQIYSPQSQERLGAASTSRQRPRAMTSRSLTSSLRRLSERTSGVLRPPPGHEKLGSREVSPAGPKPYDSKLQADAQYKDVHANAGNNWEYFDGNTVFCWGGRLQNARDKPVSIITALLVLIPSGLFFGFSAPWLWHHVSPAIPIVYAYLLFVCMSSYFHASVTDPGILPRNLHPQAVASSDPLDIGPPTTEWVVVKSAVAQHGAFEVPTKYCKSCNIWRPPRCHHCRVCDNCVDTQDHHCLWLNNCVGRRNYRYFFSFVASGTLLGIYLWGASLGHLLGDARERHRSFAWSLRHNGVATAMFVYGLVIFLYPAALCAYHIFLIVRGQTTREYLNSNKFLKKDRHRPFRQKTWAASLVTVLLRPRPPTNLNFKRKYEEGDQRFGQRRGQRTTPLAKEQQGGGGGVEMQRINGAQPYGRGNNDVATNGNAANAAQAAR